MDYTDSLLHYGTPKHSGRFQYGTGEYPRAAIRNGDVILSKTKRKAKKVVSGVSKATANIIKKYRAAAAERKARNEAANILKQEALERKRIAAESERRAEQEERDRINEQKAKEDRLKKLRDPNWVQRHVKEMTDDEIYKATQRFNNEANLRKARLNKLNAGKDYLDFILGYGQSGLNIAKMYKDVQNFAKNNSSDDPYSQVYAKKLLKREVDKHRKTDHDDEDLNDQLKSLQNIRTLEALAKGQNPNNQNNQKQKKPKNQRTKGK